MNSGGDNGDAGLVSMSAKQSGKDFILEVCRESTRNRCKRSESQCRYAHPPPNIHVVDGKVQCCADFLKVTVCIALTCGFGFTNIVLLAIS